MISIGVGGAWSQAQKVEFDAVMLQYWDEKWDAIHEKQKALYHLALKDIPTPCIEAAVREIKMDQKFRVLPSPRALADAASKEFRRWKDGRKDAGFKSREDKELSILADLCAEIQDSSGKTWRFIGDGMEDPERTIFHSYGKFKPAQIKEVIARAKSKYGDPLPTPVYVSADAPEGKKFIAEARKLSKAFSQAAVEEHDLAKAARSSRANMATGKKTMPLQLPPKRRAPQPQNVKEAREIIKFGSKSEEPEEFPPPVDFDALRKEAEDLGKEQSEKLASPAESPTLRAEFDAEGASGEAEPSYDPPAF